MGFEIHENKFESGDRVKCVKYSVWEEDGTGTKYTGKIGTVILALFGTYTVKFDEGGIDSFDNGELEKIKCDNTKIKCKHINRFGKCDMCEGLKCIGFEQCSNYEET